MIIRISEWSLSEGILFVLSIAALINIILFFILKKVFDRFDRSVLTSVSEGFMGTIRYTGISILLFIFSIFGYTDNQDDSQDQDNNK